MKTKLKAIRVILFLLCTVMLIPLLAACNNGEAPAATEANTTVGFTGPETDENGKIKDNVPDLDFGMTFDLIASENQKQYYYALASDVDNVKAAIYDRNITVEDRLGIEIKWTFMPCFNPEDKIAFSTAIENDGKVNAGLDAAIDASVSYNLVPYHISSKGALQNLNKTKYIDLTSPWWPDEYLENMLYRERVYALVDNVSVGTLTNLSCIFFNNEMLEARKIESPYDIEARNEWTVPKLRELCKDTYEDTDNNSKKSVGDTFGICTSTYARVTCWYYAAGIRMSEINEDGEMVLTGNDTAKIDTALKTISTLFDNDNGLINDSEAYVMFEDRRAYFYLSVLSMATDMNKKEIEIDYGVIPNPKLNSEQKRYYTHMPNAHDAWCVPIQATNKDCSSAFLELMASEAYRQVNDVFFEQNLKIRYAPDQKLAAMYDKIRESIVFDYVYIHKESTLTTAPDDSLRNCIKDPVTYNWQTEWDRIGSALELNFRRLMDAYNAVRDE